MNFFKTRDTSVSRRSAKVWALRLRKLCLVLFIMSAVLILGVRAFHNGSLDKASAWVKTQALAASSAAGFKVNAVLLVGRQNISQEDITAHLNIRKNDPIFGISITVAQKDLSGISWVKDVLVSRRLPDTVVINVTERQPAALWQYKKKISLIDIEGKVLTSSGLENWPDLPLLVGKTVPEHAAEMLSFLQAEPTIAAQLDAAIHTTAQRWDIVLKNKTTIKLPAKDAELALRHLATLQEQNGILDKNLVSIDLRVPDKMVIRRGAAAEPQTKEKI